ncbi:MAG TPA: FecR domain-containing protein, partial [Gemmatimonadaceae bacterium]
MDIELLRRYVLGECDAAEREAVARWADIDPARREVIEAIRQLAAEPDAWTQRFEWREALGRRAARLMGPRERVVQVRHGPAAGAGGRRRAAAWALAAAVVLALGVDMAWRPLARVWRTPEPVVAMREVAARRGQRAEITLTDGTRVELAAGSRLTYPAAFAASARVVTLDGEAYFDVRHDPSHPFEVRTRNGVIRDVGTAFLVRNYDGDARLEVVVSAGRVAVRNRALATDSGVVMDAGHMLQMDSVGRADVRAVDAQRYLEWMHGTLAFDETPLRDVAAQLSRWYDADIVVADTALAHRRFTGTFHEEPLDSVLR